MSIYTYNCDPCDFHSNVSYDWERHKETNKHNMTKEELKQHNYEKGLENLDKGDALEDYFVNLYKEFEELDDVVRIGFTSNKYDIKIKFKDEEKYRGIQVKSFSKKKNQYEISLGTSYDDNTLIVSSDSEHKTFIIFPYKDFKNKKVITMRFIKGTLYYQYFYDTLDKFKEELIKQSKLSTIIIDERDTLTEDSKQEYDSLKRLEKKCEELQLSYKRNPTNKNQIDCFINDTPIQCKSCSNTVNEYFRFWLGKSDGRNGKIPYNENINVNFFIFEITTDKYKGNFYVVPKSVLSELKCFSGKNTKGKNQLDIYPDGYKIGGTITHWSEKYLNNFDLIKEFKGDELIIDVSSPSKKKKLKNKHITLDKKLDQEKIEYKIGKINSIFGIVSIMDKKIRYSYNESIPKNNIYKFHFTFREDGKTIPLKQGMFEFYIFEIGGKYKGNYYIIPESYFLSMKLLTTDDYKGKSEIYLRSPEVDENNWNFQYLNRFDFFRDEIEFEDRLELKLDELELDYKKTNTKITSIMGKKIQYKHSSKQRRGYSYVFNFLFQKNGIKYSMKKGMFKFYVFEISINKGNYYIFPEQILIDRGYIETETNDGVKSFSILPPNIKTNNWSLKYLNRFDLLKY